MLQYLRYENSPTRSHSRLLPSRLSCRAGLRFRRLRSLLDILHRQDAQLLLPLLRHMQRLLQRHPFRRQLQNLRRRSLILHDYGKKLPLPRPSASVLQRAIRHFHALLRAVLLPLYFFSPLKTARNSCFLRRLLHIRLREKSVRKMQSRLPKRTPKTQTFP